MEHVEEQQPPTVLTSDTENATVIRGSEDANEQQLSQRKQAQVKRWRAYNTGMWNGPQRENKKAMYRQDNLHRYDAISSQCQLTPYQKERGRNLLDELNFRDLGKPVDYWLWAICVVVTNDDADGKRYWPHPSRADEDNCDIMQEMAESLGMTTQSAQMSALMKVKSETGL